MIDKSKLSEMIHNECHYGLYDDMPFWIIPDWHIIRMNEKYNLDFEYILGLLESDYNYPITEDCIKEIIQKKYYKDLIDNGQQTFINIDTDISEVDNEILEVYQDNIDNDPIYWVNDYITDNINPVDWGFNDEYQLCDECSQVIFRISPDSYQWRPDYYQDNDGYRYCEDCAEDTIEDNIQEINNAIDNNNQPKSLSQIFDLDDNWYKIDHPYGQHANWENGMHNGQNDDPLRQGKIIRTHTTNGIPIFEVCFRVYSSQFYIYWDTFIRINPDISDNDFVIHINENLDYWIDKFANDFISNGKFPYDNATLAEKALKSLPNDRKFNSINWDAETGDINIISTNDFEEYQNLIK